ncbi:AaceriAFL231Cp [[Ashbya] aceris (nom. inval.)]|nr:AaceriAFL231Cp [[Ashbya] aceris (nom. inval.)]
MSLTPNHMQNLFGDDAGGSHNTGHGTGGEDVTPALLLEQLAYVDNFMTDLDPDFSNLDTLLGDRGATAAAGLPLDERLAAELSAFADESFIFPDEEKHDGESSADHADEVGASALADAWARPREDAAGGRRAQLLSERRNTFLAAQYDSTRQRFSRQAETAGAGEADHGGFINYDTAPAPAAGDFALDVEQAQAPAAGTQARQRGPAPPSYPNIQMPEYSRIPTATLVALLPKVEVPPGALRSLLQVGFSRDQVDAVCAIMAYHQTRGVQISLGTVRAVPSETQRSRTPLQGPSMTYGSAVPGSEQRESPDGAADNNPAMFFLEMLSQQQDRRRSSAEPTEGQEERDTRSSVAPEEPQRQSWPRTASRDIGTMSNVPLLGSGQSNSDNLSVSAGRPLTEGSSAQLMQAKTTYGNTTKAHLRRKQKELELEKSVQELSQLATTLKQRIQTLEMENRLLKNIVVEKGEPPNVEKSKGTQRHFYPEVHEGS